MTNNIQQISKIKQSLLQTEKQLLAELLSHSFGYHLIQLGLVSEQKLFTTSRITHRCCVMPTMPQQKTSDSIIADYDALPFLPDSIDIAILPHTLESQKAVASILAEVWQALMPQGYIIVIGFDGNFFSNKIFAKKRKNYFPLFKQAISKRRMANYLQQVGFEIDQVKNVVPNLSHKTPKWLFWLRKFMMPSANLYIYVAKKTVTTLTPIKPCWRKVETAPVATLAEPSRRNTINDSIR